MGPYYDHPWFTCTPSLSYYESRIPSLGGNNILLLNSLIKQSLVSFLHYYYYYYYYIFLSVIFTCALFTCLIFSVRFSRFIRETLKISTEEDITRLITCSLVLLSHVYLMSSSGKVPIERNCFYKYKYRKRLLSRNGALSVSAKNFVMLTEMKESC